MLASDEMALSTTVAAAPATHTARQVVVTGAARPTVNGDRMYMATGSVAQQNDANIASRTIIISEAGGFAPPPSVTYAYNAVPPPLPPSLVVEGGTRSSAHATRTWSSVSPRTQPTPGQPLPVPGVQFYSSNHGVAYNGTKCTVQTQSFEQSYVSERSIALRARDNQMNYVVKFSIIESSQPGEVLETTTVVSAPATHTARPVLVTGAARPMVNGDRMYMATGSVAQPNAANVTSRTIMYSEEVEVDGPPPPSGTIIYSGGVNGPPSGTIITSEVEGPPPSRPGNYAYRAAPPPLPPTLVVEGGTPGLSSGTVAYSYQTYVTSTTEPAPGQPLPGVQFYSSNQPVPLALPPRSTANHDSLI